MSPTACLISIAIMAWLVQIVLGWWQVRRFNRAFDALFRRGAAVGVGRASGRFRARTIVELAFDEDERVCDGFIMRGLTVFARPEPLTDLLGLRREQLRPAAIFPEDRACQSALSLALKPKT